MWPGFIKKECNENATSTLTKTSQSLFNDVGKESQNITLSLQLLLPIRKVSCRHLYDKLLTTIHCDQCHEYKDSIPNLIKKYVVHLHQLDLSLSWSSEDESILKRLLSPSISSFVTPWLVAWHLVSNLRQLIKDHVFGTNHASTHSMVYMICEDINHFLNETSEIWFEEARKRAPITEESDRARYKPPDVAISQLFSPRKALQGEMLTDETPRYYILELLREVIQSLNHKQNKIAFKNPDRQPYDYNEQVPDSTHVEKCTIMLLEIAGTIISISRGLDEKVLDECMDICFITGIDEETIDITLWLKFAEISRTCLRVVDWDSIYDKVKKGIEIAAEDSLKTNFYNLVPHFVSMSFTREPAVDTKKTLKSPDYKWIRWQKLIIHVLMVVTTDPGIYTKTEEALTKSLSTLDFDFFDLWIKGVEISVFEKNSCGILQQNHAKAIDLAELNTILLTCRACNALAGSELAANILNDCRPSQSNSLQSNQAEICRKLMSRKFIDMLAVSGTMQNDQDVRQSLAGAIYVGNGCFTSKKKKNVSLLSKLATIVHRSLFLCDSVGFDREFLERCANIRAESLAIFGLSSLKSFDTIDLQSYICAIVCIVVVYIEISALRAFVAEELRNLICIQNQSQQKNEVSASHFSELLGMLVNSNKINFSGESSSELDTLADIFVHPMPSPVFIDLSRALLPLQSVRKILLSLGHSQICLPLAPERWIRSKGQEQDTSVSTLEAMRCGLLSLVILISFTPWTDCEAQAWIIMSTFLVEGNQYIPSNTRSWLILEILKLVDEDFFEISTQEHLLRACLVRILSFVYNDDLGSDSFIFSNCYHWSASVLETDVEVDHGCPIEDIAAVFALTLALIRRLCDRKRSCLAVYHSCWLILQGLVPTNHQGAEEFSELQVPLPREIGSDDWLVVVFFQAFILSLNENGFLDCADWGSVSLTEIGSMLAQRELGTMERFLSNSTVPSWMKIRTKQLKPTTRASVKQVGMLQTKLLDLLVEIFAEHKNISYDNKQTLSGKLSAILTRKRRFVREAFIDIGQKRCSSVTGTNNLKLTSSLIELFASDVKRIVTCDGDVLELKCIIETLIEFCEPFGERIVEDSFDHVKQLHVMVHVYEGLVTETESLKLIWYLEKKCFGSIHSICDFPVSTSHGIDIFVRNIRWIILKRIKQVLQSILSRDVSMGSQLLKPIQVDDVTIEFTLKVVDILVSDLREGLEGKSGGLTNDMFGLFIDSIEMTTMILMGMSEIITSESDIDDVLDVCNKVQMRLDDVLCSCDIVQTNLAKKTFFVCTSKLVTIAQRMCYNYCTIGCVEKAKKNIRNFRIGFKMFEELADVLRHRVESGRHSSGEWLDFVNADHLSDDDKEADDAKPVSVLSSVFGRDRGSPTRKKRRCSRLKKIRLCREESWTISFACLLESFQQYWNEQRFLQPTTRLSNDSILGYFSYRTEELLVALESVTLLFRDSERLSPLVTDEMEFANQQSIDGIYLPVKVKLSLLSLVGKILSASTKATCNLVNLFSESTKSKKDNAWSFVAAEDMAIVFSMTALRSKCSDFTAGLLKWIYAEQRNNIEDTPSLRKSVKGIHGSLLRFEELELMLRKLWQTLKSRSVSPDRDSKCVIEYVNNFMPRSKSRQSGASFTFLQLIMDRILFNDEKKSEIVALQASLSETLGKKIIDTCTIKKRAASLRDDFPSLRSLRSRNEIVNKWIQIDRENTDFSSADEIENDETYPDLEDFIVDG
jgi:hypothetical protein